MEWGCRVVRCCRVAEGVNWRLGRLERNHQDRVNTPLTGRLGESGDSRSGGSEAGRLCYFGGHEGGHGPQVVLYHCRSSSGALGGFRSR